MLVLEDETSIRSFINVNLKRNDFVVVEAVTGEEAIYKAEQEGNITIAILDVMLSGIDGFEVCKILRERYPEIGIIMLTARGMEQDKVTGLALGADDYIVKPFSPSELIARVNSLLRRMKMTVKCNQHKQISSGLFTIKLGEKKLYKCNQEIELTPKEFDIVKTFMENPNKALSRDELLDQVWGYNYVGDVKIVDVNIRRIRQKIEENPAEPQFIEKVWGYGYRWQSGN